MQIEKITKMLDNDFVEYYNSLPKSEQNELLEDIIDLKLENEWQEAIGLQKNDEDVITKIDNIYKNLLNNSNQNQLTRKENNLLLDISARYIINNIAVDDRKLMEYIFNYLLDNRQYKPEEIVLYLNYFRCFLNDYHNKEIEFNFKNSLHCNYEFGIPIKIKIKEMMVNACAFRKLLHQEKLSEGSYNHHLMINNFLVVHEYAHALQQDYINRNNNDITENYKIESIIMKKEPNFYQKYHDSFDTEIEADDYANRYVPYLVHGFMHSNDIQFFYL